ncbi:hypothetical protein TNCV_1251711 [Trichonephila clavipes]|nr:hypothetical protein TNCV_1251711 [Trichonephila clavipes]
MIDIVFKASADIGEKFVKLCNPADCHPPVSFPSPLLKKCPLFNDFPIKRHDSHSCIVDRVVVYSASTPQVWGSLNGLRKVDSAFHPRYIGSPPSTYWRCHQSGVHRVQCIEAGRRHPFWLDRRAGKPRQQPVEVHCQEVMSGGLVKASNSFGSL